MRFTLNETLLRKVLKIDATICLVSGLVMVALASSWAAWTGLPETEILASAVILFPVSALMFWTGTRNQIPQPALIVVLLGNTAWIASSLWILLSGTYPLTGFGTALLIAQTVMVVGLADLELMGLLGLRKDRAEGVPAV